MEAPKLHGRFVWYDLMSPDEDASKAFYSSVAGWTTEPFQPVPEMPVYTMWMAGAAAIGGIGPIPEGQNIPPHWLLYIGADNVDETAEAIKNNGGTIMHGPEDIPTVGRFAMCQDPQGAVFAVFTPLTDMPGAPPEPGTVSWNELATTDADAGLAFYRSLFGWGDAGTQDMGGGMLYSMFEAGGMPIGGVYTIPTGMDMPMEMKPAWCAYILTGDLDAACDRVKSGGGQILNGPMDVPGGSRVAVCLDAHGAYFGLHEAGPEMAESIGESSSEAAA